MKCKFSIYISISQHFASFFSQSKRRNDATDRQDFNAPIHLFNTYFIEPLSESGHCDLEEEINMTIVVSAFITLVQDLRRQMCNPKSSSKCPVLVNNSVFYRTPWLQTHREITIEIFKRAFSILQAIPIPFYFLVNFPYTLPLNKFQTT